MNKSTTLKLIQRTLLLGGVLLGSATMALAQDASLSSLEQENQALSSRVKALEELVEKAGLSPAAMPAKPVSSMANMTISGFVQTSYFTDLYNSQSARIPTYLWNNKNSSFSINKVKLTFASTPAARSDSDWSAAFRVSLMAGEDAPILNSSSGTTGFDYLREAYVEMNAPIGKGLIIRAGEMISLLNWESGDGGAANPNFSQGYQWYYTGNGPAAGLQADYAFTDWLDVKARVSNGLFAGPSSTGGKASGIVSVDLTPNKDSWVNLIGFGGNGVGNENVNGASAIGGYQFTSKLGTGFEADYFRLNIGGTPPGTLWSLGGWVWYDFTPKIGIAGRVEYLNAGDGVGLTAPSVPAPFGSGIVSSDVNGKLESFTVTLNWHPVPYLKIQPEFRVNHTSFAGGFAGKQYEYIIGCGATYSF